MLGAIRSFFAVELSNELKQAVDALQRMLDSPRYNVRWVQPGNVHLTLRFLGEITEEELEAASGAAARAAAKGAPFRISLRGLGAFPSPGSPRIVWAGIEQCDPLRQLEGDLTRELREARFPPPDKPFSPHLTLGRVKRPPGKEDLRRQLQRHQELVLGQQEVQEFSLIRSDLRSAGPVYEALTRFTLGSAPP